MGIFDKIKSIQKLNEDALKYVDKTDCSWHDTYKNSSYIYIGNLDKDVTEGDIIVMFSQYGEPIDINLVRDEDTGESKGYCFLAYADQRSTILAVDNFIGYKILSRPLVVDHVLNYRLPKKYKNMENKEKKEYKPTGAEGQGIGVYNILKKENPKEDAQNIKEEKENVDEDKLLAMNFQKSLKEGKEEKEKKEKKEKKKEKEKQRTREKEKTREKYESSDDISERSLSKKRKKHKKKHRKNEYKEKKLKTIYREKRKHSDIDGEYENPCSKKSIIEKYSIMCSDKYREQRRRYSSSSSSSSSSYDKYKHKRYRYKHDDAYKDRKRNISKERT